MPPRLLSLVLLFGLPWLAADALADPQVSVALTLGGGIREKHSTLQPAFQLGVWADLLMFRTREHEMALGPYLHVDTLGFDSLNLGGGVSWLLPIGTPVLIVSAGALARKTESWEAALQTRLFFGARSFNFHSVYGFALGGFLQGGYGLSVPGNLELTAGLQADLVILGLPFILAYQALRGRPPTFR